MNPTYYLFLITFLAFPILGIILSPRINIKKYKKLLIILLITFLIHNILYLNNFSLKGDYADYLIFSAEYLLLCIIVFLKIKYSNLFLKLLKILGILIIAFGILQGIIGILMFIVISQDYETDKIYNFTNNNINYQTRRYSFGFATLDDTRYTFETYRSCKYFPLEKRINKSDFFDNKSNLDFRDENFKVNIRDSVDKKLLEFSSTNGKKYNTLIN